MVEVAPKPDVTITRELTRCKLIVHRSYVNEYILAEVSRTAVDEMITLMDAVLRVAPANIVYPTLINTAVGMQPINYVMTQMRVLTTRYPNRPRGRLAVLIPSSPLTGVLDVFLRPVMHARFFAPHQRDDAIEWLAKD